MSRPQLPQKLCVRYTAGGKPLPGAMIAVTIKALRKNNFSLVFGPADIYGYIYITREELIDQAMSEKIIAQMDYGDPELDFAGEVVIAPMNREDLDRAIVAYKMFSDVSSYPPGWLELLLHSKNILGQLPVDCIVSVQVEAESNTDVRLVLTTTRP